TDRCPTGLARPDAGRLSAGPTGLARPGAGRLGAGPTEPPTEPGSALADPQAVQDLPGVVLAGGLLDLHVHPGGGAPRGEAHLGERGATWAGVPVDPAGEAAAAVGAQGLGAPVVRDLPDLLGQGPVRAEPDEHPGGGGGRVAPAGEVGGDRQAGRVGLG